MPVNPFAGLAGLISPEPGLSHGAGPGALGALGADLRQRKISQGYLDLQRGQQEWKQQQDVMEMHERERSKRQSAMLALNQAVRTGVKADILSAAQQARALGLEVDLDPDFMSSLKPEDLAPKPAAKAPMSADDQKLSDELDAVEKEQVGAIRGESPGRFIDLDTGKEETAAEFSARLAMQPPGAPPVAPSPTPSPQMPVPQVAALPPMGPGLGMPQAPRKGYRVRDPMYGGEFEITPEEIIAEQTAAVGAAFAPAEGVTDPIYAQGRKVGAQMAESLIGLVPLDEAIARGEKAEALYNANMLKQLGIEAQAKKKGGGGKGGGAGFGAPGKSGFQVYGTVSDNVQKIIDKVEQSENYQKRQSAIDQSDALIASFDEKSGVGDRNALGQYIKSISGAATTDKERGFYESSAGIKARMQNILGTWTEGGKLAPDLIRELRSLVERTKKLAIATQRKVKEGALEAAEREISLGLSEAGVSDETRKRGYVNSAAGRLGLPEVESGTGGGTESRTQRLLRKARGQ